MVDEHENAGVSPKWRVKVVRTTEEYFEVHAKDEAEALQQVDAALIDGCQGEKFSWISTEPEDPVKCCFYCGEPPDELFDISCCKTAVEAKKAKKEGKQPLCSAGCYKPNFGCAACWAVG